MAGVAYSPNKTSQGPMPGGHGRGRSGSLGSNIALGQAYSQMRSYMKEPNYNVSRFGSHSQRYRDWVGEGIGQGGSGGGTLSRGPQGRNQPITNISGFDMYKTGPWRGGGMPNMMPEHLLDKPKMTYRNQMMNRMGGLITGGGPSMPYTFWG